MGITFIPNTVRLNGRGGGQKMFGGTEAGDKLALMANQTRDSSSCINIGENGSVIDPCVILNALAAQSNPPTDQVCLFFDTADDKLKVIFDSGVAITLATKV